MDGWKSQLTESIDSDVTLEEDGEFENSLKEISNITQNITEELSELRKLVEESTASLLEIGMFVNGSLVISPPSEKSISTFSIHGNSTPSTNKSVEIPSSSSLQTNSKPGQVAGVNEISQVNLDAIDIDLETLESIEVPTQPQRPAQNRSEPDLSELEELIIAGTAMSLNSSVTPDNVITDKNSGSDNLITPDVFVTPVKSDINCSSHVCVKLIYLFWRLSIDMGLCFVSLCFYGYSLSEEHENLNI